MLWKVVRWVRWRSADMSCGSGSGWSLATPGRRVRVSGERWHGCQAGQPHQVVRGGHQIAREVDTLEPAVACLAQAANRFHPAEDFFNPFAHLLAGDVARSARRPSVDGTAAAS